VEVVGPVYWRLTTGQATDVASAQSQVLPTKVRLVGLGDKFSVVKFDAWHVRDATSSGTLLFRQLVRAKAALKLPMLGRTS
jgi:hypothetical protein